jgi:hypothetical protein
MTKGNVRHDLVTISPTLLRAQHVAPFDELGEDPVGSALGDPNRGGDVAQADPGSCATQVRTWAWLVRKSQPARGEYLVLFT